MVDLYSDIKLFLDSLLLEYKEDNGQFVYRDKNIVIIPVTFSDIYKTSCQKYEEYEAIYIYQDRWKSDKCDLKIRIKSRLGIYTNVFARKCVVKLINERGVVREFLNENHPYGDAKSKYNFGLFYKDELIAVSSFSASRPLPRRIDNPYVNVPKGEHKIHNIVFVNSYEWVRFAMLPHLRVVGGMGKLLSAFISYINSQGVINNYEVMTYSDNEWSSGNGYVKLGFRQCGDRSPVEYYVEKSSNKRYSINGVSKIKNFRNEDYIKITNCGSKKFILSLRLLATKALIQD